MKAWMSIGAFVLSVACFAMLWSARADFRARGCVDAPDGAQCADALMSVWFYGGAGAAFATIALILTGRKRR